MATLGKFGGTLVAARLTGLGWRDAAALGILMNTRGLMELIVLNIGLDLGVISPTLFAMMVIMALVTTIATTPILDALSARGDRRGNESAAGRDGPLAFAVAGLTGAQRSVLPCCVRPDWVLLPGFVGGTRYLLKRVTCWRSR